MKALMLTREYPPHVYGGAGVVVTALAHAMPFSPAERQVLMETPDLRELEGVLLQLMATGPGGTLGFDMPPLWPS